jgi:hypothetical protein
MSIRTVLKLLAASLLVFAAAFALRRAFFWDVMPVSWDQEPQTLWALGAAFLLSSIENLSAIVAAVTLVVVCVLRLRTWRSAISPRRRPAVPEPAKPARDG